MWVYNQNFRLWPWIDLPAKKTHCRSGFMNEYESNTTCLRIDLTSLNARQPLVWTRLGLGTQIDVKLRRWTIIMTSKSCSFLWEAKRACYFYCFRALHAEGKGKEEEKNFKEIKHASSVFFSGVQVSHFNLYSRNRNKLSSQTPFTQIKFTTARSTSWVKRNCAYCNYLEQLSKWLRFMRPSVIAEYWLSLKIGF